MDTKDIPVAWLADHEVDTSGPRRPLSEAAPFVFAYIEPGTDSVEILVPTLVDTRSEAAESIVLSITEAGGAILPDPVPQLVGTVNDPA